MKVRRMSDDRASLSQILYSVEKQKQKQNMKSESTARNHTAIKKGSDINEVVMKTMLRRAKRSRTNTLPLATKVITKYDAVFGTSTIGNLVINTTTKFRILGSTSEREEEGWHQFRVGRIDVLNNSLTLVETTDGLYEKLILQGRCSVRALEITCYIPSIILLYGNVFWCLQWKLTNQF